MVTVLWVLFFSEVSRGGFANESSQNNRSAMRFIIGISPILVFWLAAELFNIATLNRDRYRELRKKVDKMQGELDHLSFGERDKFMNPSRDNTPATVDDTEAEEVSPPPEISEPDDEDLTKEVEPDLGSPATKGETQDGISKLEEWNLDAATLTRAFNLPNDENDTEGYDAIEAAVKIESLSTLLQNSHQILYTLADYDLIMDDLEIDMGLISTWRKFATDSPEGMISSLGGTGTFLEIDKVTSIVAENNDFEERANSFNKQMEEFISQAIPQLTDDEIKDLAQTRTFRAFLLLGQVFNSGG